MAKGAKRLVSELNAWTCGFLEKRFSFLIDGCCLRKIAIQKNIPKAVILILANFEILLSYHDQVNFLIGCSVINGSVLLENVIKMRLFERFSNNFNYYSIMYCF